MLQKPPAGFLVPDFTAPLDTAYVLRTLPQGTLKGSFVGDLLQRAKIRGLPPITTKKYIFFKDYPLQEAIEIFLELIPKLYPDVPIREAIRRNGHAEYGTFLNSMLGKALLGRFISISFHAKLIPKIYSLLSSYGKVSLTQVSGNSLTLLYENVPDLIDCADVGSLEGGFLARNVTHQVYFRRLGVGHGELFCTWKE
jgi:uncharacterized protein (TIGR02265 family)